MYLLNTDQAQYVEGVVQRTRREKPPLGDGAIKRLVLREITSSRRDDVDTLLAVLRSRWPDALDG